MPEETPAETPSPDATDAPRIACLEVPLFPLAARTRSEPELREEALAVLAGRGNAARVVAATRLARRAGVRPGLTLTQARARLPKLIARPRDPECEQAAREALLDVAESFSPRVEDAGEGRLFLDASGLDRLHPGEAPEVELGRELMRAAEKRAGVPVWVGIASSKLAAQLAAGRAGSPNVVPAGDEGTFLDPMPLQRVTPEASTLATLERWGIHTLGELSRLPEAEVISRLGDAGRELQAIARGEDPRPLSPRQPPPAFREGMELEWPLVQLEPFVFVARSALERLTRRMRGRGLGCIRLELAMELEPDGHHQRSLDLPAPTRDVKTLLTLLRLDLEAHPPGAPIVAFTLTAHPDRPRSAQLSLFGPDALSPDQLATTVARLFSLLGEERVGSPRPADAHRPERFSLLPYAPPPPPEMRRRPRPARGFLALRTLRPPIEIEVIAGEGRSAATSKPLSVRALAREEEAKKPRIDGRVRVASGPWGLEEEWWSEDACERDYWDVELDGGGLFRIFRDRRSGDWFADGVYD